MSTKTFNKGDTVYSDDGIELEYIARVNDGHVVRALVDDGEGIWSCSPILLQAVFAEAPVMRYVEGAAEAKRELQDAENELRKIRGQISDATRERDAALKRFAAHPDLQPIVEWLDGKITHVATLENYGGITIKPIAEAVMPANADDRRNGEVRLLALYGGYTGPEPRKSHHRGDDLRWQLNHYRDGSGSNTACILGTSEENVRERLQAYLDRALTKQSSNSHGVLETADSALKLGLRVPDSLAAMVAERRRKNAESAITRAQANVTSAERTLAESRRQLEKATAESQQVAA